MIASAWIDGVAAPATSTKFAVLNPATNIALMHVDDCGTHEAQRAVDAAERALPAWRNTLARERSNLLRRWHALMLENAEDLAQLMSLEQGKPLAEARGEVRYGASFLEWFAEEAVRTNGEIIPETVHGRKLLVVKEPVGIIAAITPWNFPIAMLTRKLAPALAAGCTAVCKPAEDTPLCALALAKLATEAGIPAGVINVVPASRERGIALVGAWLQDKRVRKISFTGSTAVGKYLAERSAATLKRLSLELGGNAPFIVFDDADLDQAVAGLIASKFRNTGQTCVSANRIYVQSGIYDVFADKLAATVNAMQMGPAAPESTATLGPLINSKAVDKVAAHVADAVSHGAHVVTGGERDPQGDNFYRATVLTNATAAMRLAAEETFGPVAALFRFTTEDEVVQLANAADTGLAAYFYSRDLSRIWRVSAALQVGMVGVNEGILSTEVAPFGGIKQSGYGREGSHHGIDEYLNLKYICLGGLAL